MCRFAGLAIVCCALAIAGGAAAQDGDPARGRATHELICGVCHGAKGEGGAGLPLKNIAGRTALAETVEKIKNPKDPMPGLFPAVLDEQAVQDVAAFVRTLQ